jgi:PhzF family phenazine biosynthesis protein
VKIIARRSAVPDDFRMKVPYYHVDAFTGDGLLGNPAGVCVLKDWLPDAVLQAVAAENNLSETAFIIERDGFWDLRWFTPTTEVDLCGHATLASAFVITKCLGRSEQAVQFQSRSGLLKVACDGELLVLDFPARPPAPCAPPEHLASALGRKPISVLKARDYLVLLESEEDVRNLQPDISGLGKIEAYAFIATAPGRKADFVSRFFAPRVGVPEDPVTGSAHCTLIPYWAARLGKQKLHALQLSKRGGELFCENRGERVGIGGRARLYLRGELDLSSWKGA